LVKKASIDPAFKAILLERRAAAADDIDLKLEPAEAAMLAAAPREQLEAIIARTNVPVEHRRAFLGHAAAAMVAAVAATAASSGFAQDEKPEYRYSKGMTMERPKWGVKIDETRVFDVVAKTLKIDREKIKRTTELTNITEEDRAKLIEALKKEFDGTTEATFETFSYVYDIVTAIDAETRVFTVVGNTLTDKKPITRKTPLAKLTDEKRNKLREELAKEFHVGSDKMMFDKSSDVDRVIKHVLSIWVPATPFPSRGISPKKS
jgi:hypothetical protein